jgi:hypothetical protein
VEAAGAVIVLSDLELLVLSATSTRTRSAGRVGELAGVDRRVAVEQLRALEARGLVARTVDERPAVWVRLPEGTVALLEERMR